MTTAKQQQNRRVVVLTAEKVRTARALHRAGETVTEIARHLSVNRGTLNSAIRGRTWRDIAATDTDK